jgi:uncharacterized protein
LTASANEPWVGDIPPSVLTVLRDVLGRHPSVRGAILFGSRAKGCARPGSDIDLALEGEIPIDELARIAADLDARDLAWEVDLVRLSAVRDPDVREHVARVGVSLYRKGV